MAGPSHFFADIEDSEPIEPPASELWSDEPPLESDWHRDQIETLIRLLKFHWRRRTDFYVSGNLTLYYAENQTGDRYLRGPDWFVVLGTEGKPRKSWVVWQEAGQYPHVIVELLSPATATIDRYRKKQLYQDTFRTPDYFWFDPLTLELQGFHSVDGRYRDLLPSREGHLWSQQLGLYLGLYERKLRLFTPEHQLILLPEEILARDRHRLAELESEVRVLRRQLGDAVGNGEAGLG